MKTINILYCQSRIKTFIGQLPQKSLSGQHIDKGGPWEPKHEKEFMVQLQTITTSDYPYILKTNCFEAGLGSRSRSEPGVFGSLEPEPLEKKTRSRSRSRLEKKVRSRSRSSSSLREDKNHKEIVL